MPGDALQLLAQRLRQLLPPRACAAWAARASASSSPPMPDSVERMRATSGRLAMICSARCDERLGGRDAGAGLGLDAHVEQALILRRDELGLDARHRSPSRSPAARRFRRASSTGATASSRERTGIDALQPRERAIDGAADATPALARGGEDLRAARGRERDRLEVGEQHRDRQRDRRTGRRSGR